MRIVAGSFSGRQFRRRVAQSMRRRRLQLYAAISVAMLCSAPAHAFSDCESALINLRLEAVEQATNILLEKARARDVFGSPAEQQAYHDSGASQRNQADRRTISRRVAQLWRIKVARSVLPGTLIVRHRLAGTDSASIAHSELSDARMDVTITALRPVVACRNASHQIIEGSVDLTLSVGQLALAGRYLGTIETDVRVPR